MDKFCTATTPVFGGARGPQNMARQCMCSLVYLSIRCRPLQSSVAYTGIVWYRLHPIETIIGSLVFSNFLCHLCLFILTWNNRKRTFYCMKSMKVKKSIKKINHYKEHEKWKKNLVINPCIKLGESKIFTMYTRMVYQLNEPHRIAFQFLFRH